MRPSLPIALLAATFLSACTVAHTITITSTTAPATLPTLTPTGGGGGGAEACYNKFHSSVDAIARDLPAISTSAEDAAKLFVQDDYQIGAAGDHALVQEMFGRCGGLMSLQDLHIPKNGPWKGIVLYALKDAPADEDAFYLRYFHDQGAKVILFGRKDLIQKIAAKGIDTSDAIENHAPALAFIEIDKRYLVPLDQGLDIVAMWTWTAEFTAACTRLGKMPTLYKGYVFPGGLERAKAIGTAKFHDAKPTPVPEGNLANQYLTAIRETLTAFHDHELANIKQAAQLAIQARDAHHGVYAYVESHCLIWQFEEPRDPALFTRIGWWRSQRRDVQLDKGDFVLAIGYIELYGEDYGNFMQRARAAGVNTAWALGGFGPTPPAITPNELFIDQQWKADDAVVTVPGYDIKILPTSGVMQELTYAMTCSEILARRPDQSLVKK